jgi:hypothetical protein
LKGPRSYNPSSSLSRGYVTVTRHAVILLTTHLSLDLSIAWRVRGSLSRVPQGKLLE